MRTILFTLSLLAAVGCRAMVGAPPTVPVRKSMYDQVRRLEPTPEQPPAETVAERVTTIRQPEQPNQSPALPVPLPPVQKEPAPASSDAEVHATVAELVAAGRLDREAEVQLIADLEQTAPELRRQVVQLLSASLAQREAPTSEPAPESVAVEPPMRKEPLVAPRQEPVVNPSPSPKNTVPVAPDPPETVEPVRMASEVQPAPATVIATPAPPPELTWQEHLSAAIERASTEVAPKPQTGEEVARHAILRLLYLADGQRDEALRPIPGVPPAQQDFWTKELYGLASYLDLERNPSPGRRAAEAATHLRDATTRLGEIANLSVRNMAICTEVKSYGIYKRFDKYEFSPSQEVLVYAEVENFKSLPGEQGYHTALRVSYEILDQSGARVVEQELPLTEEHCQNPRRDYFIRYFVTIPPQIFGGQYTLHLYIVDEHSQKMDHASLEFSIRNKGH